MLEDKQYLDLILYDTNFSDLKTSKYYIRSWLSKTI